MPSGILHPGKLCVIGNGVVVDPRVLTDELDELRRRGVDTTGLRISANAHLIMPYHLLLDHAGEAKLGKLEIGTTRRGIGPCYADKAARLGIRVQDLLDEKILKKKIVAALEPKRLSLREFAKDPRLDLQAMTDEYLTYGHRLERYIADTSRLVLDALDAGQLVVFEGAQGALLDIDHGTYPFVTSSNPVAGAACIGAGVGPKDIDEVWGVTKAYGTRVGAGPFPTELDGAAGRRAARARRRVRHHHRPPAAGRLDRPRRAALRRADQLAHGAGGDQARRPQRDGHRSASAPATAAPRAPSSTTSPTTSRCCTTAAGEYEELPGWSEDLRGCRTEDDLPAAARDYLRFISEYVRVPVALIGVGPGRDEVIWTDAGRAPRRRRLAATVARLTRAARAQRRGCDGCPSPGHGDSNSTRRASDDRAHGVALGRDRNAPRSPAPPLTRSPPQSTSTSPEATTR